jgi:hypothetical protein
MTEHISHWKYEMSWSDIKNEMSFNVTIYYSEKAYITDGSSPFGYNGDLITWSFVT